jgi:nephrocystin-3
MAKTNKMTIIRCLQEVDNSRPYFVGLLGERYGWHQETSGADKSLTETFQVAEKVPEYLFVNENRVEDITEEREREKRAERKRTRGKTKVLFYKKKSMIFFFFC